MTPTGEYQGGERRFIAKRRHRFSEPLEKDFTEILKLLEAQSRSTGAEDQHRKRKHAELHTGE
jgi:hypothetical protein